MKKKRKSIENIIYQSEAPIYDVLLTALQEGDIDFNDNGKETAQYWFTYVKERVPKVKLLVQQQKEIRMLFNTTILLTEMTNLKEVFTYTERELNLAIFNSNVNKLYKQKCISFKTSF